MRKTCPTERKTSTKTSEETAAKPSRNYNWINGKVNVLANVLRNLVLFNWKYTEPSQEPHTEFGVGKRAEEFAYEITSEKIPLRNISISSRHKRHNRPRPNALYVPPPPQLSHLSTSRNQATPTWKTSRVFFSS